jgi:N-dimethylarginine dimethylaminohydrolase
MNWYLEGGDVVVHRSLEGKVVYFVGESLRSNRLGVERFERFLKDVENVSCISLKLVSSIYYHLDTCFLPITNVLIVAEDLEELFDENSMNMIKSMFQHVVVVKQYDREPWKICNARYIFRQDTIIFGTAVPEKLLDRLSELLGDTTILQRPLTGILAGGGGISCSTLIDQSESVVYLVRPEHCNLFMYTLNSFQKNMQLVSEKNKDHVRALYMDFELLVSTFKDLQFDVRIFKSDKGLPECLYIKDVAVLIDFKNIFLCNTSIPERMKEKDWFVKRLTSPNSR